VLAALVLGSAAKAAGSPFDNLNTAPEGPWQIMYEGGLNEVGDQVYGDKAEITDVRITVFHIIRLFLGFLGMIFIVLVVYAGWLWMTAGGNEERVTQAKDLIKNATIGLVVILLAYSITLLITETILRSINSGT